MNIQTILNKHPRIKLASITARPPASPTSSPQQHSIGLINELAHHNHTYFLQDQSIPKESISNHMLSEYSFVEQLDSNFKIRLIDQEDSDQKQRNTQQDDSDYKYKQIEQQLQDIQLMKIKFENKRKGQHTANHQQNFQSRSIDRHLLKPSSTPLHKNTTEFFTQAHHIGSNHRQSLIKEQQMKLIQESYGLIELDGSQDDGQCDQSVCSSNQSLKHVQEISFKQEQHNKSQFYPSNRLIRLTGLKQNKQKLTYDPRSDIISSLNRDHVQQSDYNSKECICSGKLSDFMLDVKQKLAVMSTSIAKMETSNQALRQKHLQAISKNNLILQHIHQLSQEKRQLQHVYKTQQKKYQPSSKSQNITRPEEKIKKHDTSQQYPPKPLGNHQQNIAPHQFRSFTKSKLQAISVNRSTKVENLLQRLQLRIEKA